VFDLGRLIALAWALFVTARARAVGPALAVVAVGYVVGLELWSGFTIRSQGPLEPAMSMLLVFLGPSALPRGPLPAWPLAHAAVAWPIATDAVVAALLVVPHRALARRSAPLRPESEEARRIDRAALAVVLLVVTQGLYAAARGLPMALGDPW
jgi:hypothetical protein